jgi:hypothetical protein
MKKPLSEKGKGNPFRSTGKLGSLTDIDPAFKAAATARNLELRWIGYKELTENQGFHKRFWEPIKRQEFSDVKGSSIMDLNFGSSADGFIRRGSMILAKRSKELSEQHREVLREKVEAYMGQVEDPSQTLRESARQSNVETIISTKYDDK